MPTTLTGRLFRGLHGRKMAAYAGIPGPTPTFPMGNALDFLGKPPWEVLEGYAKAHGGMVVFWIGGRPIVALSDPDLIARVLTDGASGFYKDAPGKALEPVITRRCLFVANGDDWAYRRSIHPASHGEAADRWMAAVVPSLRDSVASGVARLSTGDHRQGVDLYDGLERVAFDAFAVATWGETLGDEAYREFASLGRTGDRRMKSPLPSAPPLCPMFYADRRRWYGRFEGLIAKARADPDPDRLDLLALSLRHGPKVPHDDFRDLLANVFYGGVYSATSGLASALYLLAHHPSQQSRLLEALAALDLDAPGIVPTDLDACPTLGATVLESLRYFSPVPVMGRNVVTTQTVELGGHSLPADTPLFLASATIHRSPAHWPDADRFDPSRWEPGGSATDPIGGPHFFPFGQGARICVGMPFAMTYLKVALATILTKFRVQVDLAAPYQPTYFFGVMIPRGLPARFEAE